MSLNSIPLTLTDIPVGKTVTVKVPASSANLGPGYDTLGLALGYYDELTVERIAEGLEFGATQRKPSGGSVNARCLRKGRAG